MTCPRQQRIAVVPRLGRGAHIGGVTGGTYPRAVRCSEVSYPYAIAKWIQDTTDDALRVEEGSLYPALHRLEDKGFVDSKWGVSETNRQAKFYSTTAQGRQALRSEIDSWTRFSAAIAKVIAATRTQSA